MTFYFAPVFKYIFLYVLIFFTLNCRFLDKYGVRLAEEEEGEEEEQDGGRARAGRGTAGGPAGRRRLAAGRR
jgi:hypothetical protein